VRNTLVARCPRAVAGLTGRLHQTLQLECRVRGQLGEPFERQVALGRISEPRQVQQDIVHQGVLDHPDEMARHLVQEVNALGRVGVELPILVPFRVQPCHLIPQRVIDRTELGPHVANVLLAHLLCRFRYQWRILRSSGFLGGFGSPLFHAHIMCTGANRNPWKPLETVGNACEHKYDLDRARQRLSV
jgi:hypothetical protein